MPEEQLKAFLEKVKCNSSLQEKLKAVSDEHAIVSIAKDEGFMFSVEDLKNTQLDLSEKELEGVSGGIYPTMGGDHMPNCVGRRR